MKRVPFLTAIIALVLMVGCQTGDPLKQYATVQESYIVVTQIVIEARITGRISDDRWHNEVYPLIKTGDVLLDQYYAQVVGGLDTTAAVNDLRSILVQLQTFVDGFIVR
jgi:hypothetical protein